MSRSMAEMIYGESVSWLCHLVRTKAFTLEQMLEGAKEFVNECGFPPKTPAPAPRETLGWRVEGEEFRRLLQRKEVVAYGVEWFEDDMNQRATFLQRYQRNEFISNWHPNLQETARRFRIVKTKKVHDG